MAEAIEGRYYRHKKGGRYRVVGFGKDSETRGDVVIYRSLDHGTMWVRPKDEFEDEGRFEFLGDAGDTILWSRKGVDDSRHYYTVPCSVCGIIEEGHREEFVAAAMRERLGPFREWSFSGGVALCPKCRPS